MDLAQNARPARSQIAVIFDVDGTILRSGCALQRIHMGAMATAIERVAGVRTVFQPAGGDLRVEGHSLAGFTDAGTIDLVLKLAGMNPADRAAIRPAIVARMCAEVTERAAAIDGADDVLPGVATIVADLVSLGVIVGLATGNAPAVADAKMRAAGLGQFEPLLGGFGDGKIERAQVAQQAVASVRAAAGEMADAGTPDQDPLPGAHILLIGDTVSDVRAARSAGIRCLAVSTGAVSEQALRDAEPDVFFSSLAGVRGHHIVERIVVPVPQSA
jgi:phosphoglycolate phosphatase